jgi:hypothetical protein
LADGLDRARERATQLRAETLSWFWHLEKLGVDQVRLGRVATLENSLTAATHLLADVMDAAANDFGMIREPDFDWQTATQRDLDGRSAGSHMSVALKAWLFEIRAIHDALGDLLSSLVSEAPNTTSMDKRINKNDAVAETVIAAFPEYRDWFQNVRDVRNRLKEGNRALATVFHATTGVQALAFQAFTPDGRFRMTEKETIPVDTFFVEGLAMTRALMAIAVQAAGNANTTPTGA